MMVSYIEKNKLVRLCKIISTVLLLFGLQTNVHAQETIALYSGEVPNLKINSVMEITNSSPTLAIFLAPEKSTSGTGVIICPGGSYSAISYRDEGTDVAKAFNKLGVNAFVLKYRLPNDATMKDKSIGPLQDAQQAIKLIRQRSLEWNTNKVGILGFSAGGHLASTMATHFNQAFIPNSEGLNLRPDFVILCYPVISFNDSLTHKESRYNLLGANPSDDKIKFFSNELHVTPKTPPTFLVHAGDDNAVNVLNSIFFYEALLTNKVSSEMHIYPHGGHGFGLYNNMTIDRWIDRAENWMRSNKWIK